MSTLLPGGAAVEADPDGTTRYLLPRVQLGGLRWLGLILLGIDGVLISFFSGMFGIAVKVFGDLPGPGGVVAAIVVGSFGLIPLFFAVFLLYMACFLFVGRVELRLEATRLRAGWAIGPVRWWGSRTRDEVRWLAYQTPRTAGLPQEPPAAWGTSVRAVCIRRGPMLLAWGYEPELLGPVVTDLAERWSPGGPPLPIENETEGGTSQRSRSWRSPRAKVRQPGGAVARGCMTLFFLPFLAGGCLIAFLFLRNLALGDPDRQFQPAPWGYLWLLFPLPFLLVGAGGIWFTWFKRSRDHLSPERQAAPSDGPDTDDLLPSIEGTPGTTLAVRLACTTSPGCSVLGLLVALVVDLGILIPVLANLSANVRRRGVGEYFSFSGAVSLFLCLALPAILVGLFRALRQLRTGLPMVEVSSHPLHPGSQGEVWLELPTALRAESLRVSLVCEEEATYQQGTDTRREKRLVHVQRLIDRDDAAFARDDAPRARVPLELPVGAMHSFKASKNEIRWVLRLVVRTPGWLFRESTYDYPVAVHPIPRQGGAA